MRTPKNKKEYESMANYHEIFGRASTKDTLDIMVRKQARDLGVVYHGADNYKKHAEEHKGTKAYEMFLAADSRNVRIEEMTLDVLCPSDIFAEPSQPWQPGDKGC